MTAGRGGFAGLDPCVHCGFCLQACPTFLATGDEADSPRGRIGLMRALEREELPSDDAALLLHLDRCLGCRACEPVCPSGVAYGQGLEAARARIAADRGVPTLTRLVLRALTTPELAPATYALARAARATGIPGRLAGWGRIRFALGMLGASRPGGRVAGRMERRRSPDEPAAALQSAPAGAAWLFRGCIMKGLFAHVHAATARTLASNGYRLAIAPGQTCCGALHAHAGLLAEARVFAQANIAAFGDAAGPIVVNSAGCGAMLKEYPHLLPDEPAALAFAARVRDVSELLAERGPVPGARLSLRVAYDPPCHLVHAQRISDPPRRLLAAIPGLDLVATAETEQCCGGAGLYTLIQPEMSQAVLAPKLAALRALAPDVVATGNPGCQLQIGAGLAAAGIPADVRHPVELLDRAYAAAGRYA